MRNSALAPAIAGILLTAAGSAHALTTVSSNFNVTATVAASCQVSATDLAFGTYNPAADVTGNSAVKVSCTNGTAYTVKLSPGSGTYATRTMLNGASTLGYNLYTSAALSNVWGDGSASTSTVTGTGAGLSAANTVTHVVYGKLPATGNQDAPVGSYSDTITVTVEY